MALGIEHLFAQERVFLKTGPGGIIRVNNVIVSTGSQLLVIYRKNVDRLRVGNEYGLAFYTPQFRNNLNYATLIPYATPGFVVIGVCAIPAGWLADKWSRKAMMIIFFFGIGLSSIITALAETPLQIGLGLFAIGFFAAIYHPVGIALVVQGREKIGVPLAINGIFGNLGVACAPLITGFFIDYTGWRSAFV